MLIDCDTCPARGTACYGCVVNLLFGAEPPVGDDPVGRALAVLTGAGFEVTVLADEDSRALLRLVSSRKRDFHAA
jgi:hypothetical protein